MNQTIKEIVDGDRRTMRLTRTIDIPEGYELVSDSSIPKTPAWKWLDFNDLWAPVSFAAPQDTGSTYIRPIPALEAPNGYELAPAGHVLRGGVDMFVGPNKTLRTVAVGGSWDGVYVGDIRVYTFFRPIKAPVGYRPKVQYNAELWVLRNEETQVIFWDAGVWMDSAMAMLAAHRFSGASRTYEIYRVRAQDFRPVK